MSHGPPASTFCACTPLSPHQPYARCAQHPGRKRLHWVHLKEDPGQQEAQSDPQGQPAGWEQWRNSPLPRSPGAPTPTGHIFGHRVLGTHFIRDCSVPVVAPVHPGASFLLRPAPGWRTRPRTPAFLRTPVSPGPGRASLVVRGHHACFSTWWSPVKPQPRWHLDTPLSATRPLKTGSPGPRRPPLRAPEPAQG